jgi:hypothetical protein
MTNRFVASGAYNEEVAIAKVVSDFKAALPRADVYVYDNNSNDNTTEVAHVAGAIVRNEVRRGKGNVVRRMFADIEADIYILADGDDTYDATTARLLAQKLVDDGLDVVSGRRIAVGGGAYRAGTRARESAFDRPYCDATEKTASGSSAQGSSFKIEKVLYLLIKPSPDTSLLTGWSLINSGGALSTAIRRPIREFSRPRAKHEPMA